MAVKMNGEFGKRKIKQFLENGATLRRIPNSRLVEN